ncbi:MAG: aminopeptidase P family protein [Candidatus Omnitrophica bacterium]|nr:aminopeptidase P family protein [Candidatus Omnitrophota bacterium]
MNKRRINSLIKKIELIKLDAFLISKPVNLYYLTSFQASHAHLIVSNKGIIAVTDFIYAEAAAECLKDCRVITAGSAEDRWKSLSEVLRKMRIGRMGFEADYLNFADFKNISNLLKHTKLVPCINLMEEIRQVKEKGEIAAIRKSIEITGKALNLTGKQLGANKTEREIAHYIKENCIRCGAEGLAFEPIVATQPNASKPHYCPMQKRLGKDSLILLDFGALYKGYNSDLTRMRSIGKIKSRFKKIYSIILEAQKRALDSIRPGVKISDLDSAARQHIEKKGFGKFFGHSLGHGIGLEIHELPVVSGKNKNKLEQGMVFTVEPGVYIPGFGGMRIEDIALVKEKGCEVLTDDIDKSI